MRSINYFLLLLFFSTCFTEAYAYPIDGYLSTGIRRLLRLELIWAGKMKGKMPPPGGQKSITEIKLHLLEPPRRDSVGYLPETDSVLQEGLNDLFPNMHESYSVTLMDISPGKKIRYAKRQEDRGFQPGSVGKLAVISGLFCELENIYPDDYDKRKALLKDKIVRAGSWAVYDEHTVPFFDPETLKFFKRQVAVRDTFSLFEWADHMMSVSNNGAASVVWREAILMRVFGKEYPQLTEERAEEFFKSTSKADLADIAISIVRDPLMSVGITEDEWRLGQLFTRGGTSYIPGKGGSIGSPQGLMKWMVALERGDLVDPESSLEIKRLMYMTDNRIRYASNNALDSAAVYFKSGSLYKCDRSRDPNCGKYRGNVYNYMNSVAIVEHGDSTVYLVALMTNVLRRNSAYDHNILAGKIDKLIRGD